MSVSDSDSDPQSPFMTASGTTTAGAGKREKEMTTQQQQTHHHSELDSAGIDSVNSSPRSDYTPHHTQHRSQEDNQPRVRFMCSFGGQILPRPHDNQLRYVGGDTRIVAVQRFTNYSSLLSKLSRLCGGSLDFTVKYQLPNEDLDALISVSTDEDVENMMEEYDRLLQNGNPKTTRLRLFLFPNSISRTSSIGSLVGGSTRRDHWFLDALNGGSGAPLERNRSEASSIVSEVPDYLFGLDNNSDFPRDPKPKTRSHLAENVSVSDPGSPAPVLNSPYCSTSSATGVVSSIPDLPPVKTKAETPTPISAVDNRQSNVDAYVEAGGEPLISQQQQRGGGYAGKPMWQYVQPETQYSTQPVQQMPVYYIPGVPGQMHVQPVPVSIPMQQQQQQQPQYVQRFPIPSGQVPVTYRQQVQPLGQMYSGGEYQTGGGPDVMSQQQQALQQQQQQQVYYGGRNVGVGPAYQATVVSVGPDVQVSGVDTKLGRVHQV